MTTSHFIMKLGLYLFTYLFIYAFNQCNTVFIVICSFIFYSESKLSVVNHNLYYRSLPI